MICVLKLFCFKLLTCFSGRNNYKNFVLFDLGQSKDLI